MKEKSLIIYSLLNKNCNPIVPVLGLYILGVLTGRFFSVPLGYFCSLSVCSIFLSIFTKNKASAFFLLISFFLIGSLRVQDHLLVAKNDIVFVSRYYYGRQARIRGIISSDVEKRRFFNNKKTVFFLNVNEVNAPWGWDRKNGRVLVNIFEDIDLKYGEHVELKGRMHNPYNFSGSKNFSYRDYLKNKGTRLIFSVKKHGCTVLDRNRGNWFFGISLRIRNKLKKVLAENLSSNESGIMKALLLGDRSDIQGNIKELFIHTGTAHVLAVSGLHVGIVAFIFLITIKLLPLGRKAQMVITIIMLTCYAFITGLRPSVVRATIMAVVFLGSFIFEKETDSLNTLSFAALMILIFNPLNLFDAGFQLSFVSVLSIIILSPRIFDILSCIRPKGGKVYSYSARFISVSMSAWLGVSGLIIYYFNIITTISLLSNFIIIPLISIIVALGFSLILSALVLSNVAYLFSFCVKVTLNIIVGFLFLLEKVPFSYVYIKDVNLWAIAIYYSILFILFFILWRFYLKYRDNNLVNGMIDKSGIV